MPFTVSRANAGFDVPFNDSVCLDGIPGFLQVGAGATPSRCVPQCGQRDSDQTAGVGGDFCENDRLHEVLECTAASSLVAEIDRLREVLETTAASSLVAEIDRLREVLETTAASSLVDET